MRSEGHKIFLALILMVCECRAGGSHSRQAEEIDQYCRNFETWLGRENHVMKLRKCATFIEQQFSHKWGNLAHDFQSNILAFDAAIKDAKLKAEGLQLISPTNKELVVQGSIALIEELIGRIDRKLYTSDEGWRCAAKEAYRETLSDFFENYLANFEELLFDYLNLARNADANQVQILLTGRTRSLLSNARLCSTYLVGCISDDEIINAYLVEHPLWDSQNTLHSRLFSKDQLLPYEEIVKLIDEYLEFIQNQEMYAPKRAELLAVLAAGNISLRGCSLRERLARIRVLNYYRNHVNIHKFIETRQAEVGQLCRNPDQPELAHADEVPMDEPISPGHQYDSISAPAF